jgi:hypothetical protein
MFKSISENRINFEKHMRAKLKFRRGWKKMGGGGEEKNRCFRPIKKSS